MKNYRIYINRVDFGTYQGNTETEALDACARDAGYESYMTSPHGEAGNNVEIIEILPDGVVYGDPDFNQEGIAVVIEDSDVYAIDQQTREMYGPATEEHVTKAIKNAIRIQLEWARESGNKYAGPAAEELQRRWNERFPGEEM